MELPVAVVVTVLGGALFVGIWVAVSLILSRAGGWQALARAYRAPHPAPDRGWVERRALFSGHARYKNVLRLSADDAGIHLRVAWPFRLGHPPLFVPWEDCFTLARAGDAHGLHELRFRRVASPRLLVSDETLRRLDERAPAGWRAG